MRKSFTVDHVLEYNVKSGVTMITLFEFELDFIVDGSAKVPFTANVNEVVNMSTRHDSSVIEMRVLGNTDVMRLPARQGETITFISRQGLEDLSHSVEIGMFVPADDGLKVDVPDAFFEPKKPTFFWG